MKNIAVLASGAGTNARRIAEYFAAGDTARVVLIITDNPSAGVLGVALRAGIKSEILSREQIARGRPLVESLERAGADLVVLAGFLRLVPADVVLRFSGRMINIHPSLLPKYGGKGMYGHRVHEAVIQAGERESGITIHLVSEHYDQGAVLAQYRVPVSSEDTSETLEAKIHTLEYTYYPQVIESEILKQNGPDR